MFVAFELKDGLVIDRRSSTFDDSGHLPSSYPYIARAFARKSLLLEKQFEGEDYTHFVIVQRGWAKLTMENDERVLLNALEFASLTGGFVLTPGPDTTGLVISRVGVNRAYPIPKAGPLEDEGRLRYIDGCSDSLIFCPPKAGDPALNHLHIPVEVHQTPHFHPSDRIGIIARGKGVCYEHPSATRHVIKTGDMVNVDLSDCIEVDLKPGMGWLIEEGTVHSFHTHWRQPNEQALDVIAFHPETKWGPSDESHPMLDYTLVGTGRAVRGENSDGDYQAGGSSREVTAPIIVTQKPGDGLAIEVGSQASGV